MAPLVIAFCAALASTMAPLNAAWESGANARRDAASSARKIRA
jgi:hypothetical protein